MICERCHGAGFERVTSVGFYTTFVAGSGRLCGLVSSPEDTMWRPCPDCQGSGIGYCCEGPCGDEGSRPQDTVTVGRTDGG